MTALRDHVRRIAARRGPLSGLIAERDRLLGVVEDLRKGPGEPIDPRTFLAHRYLRGDGLEIGAAHLPLSVPPEARVSYLDIAPADELRRRWPEMADQALVEVDIVDDAERLERVPEGSQDFIVANHFLEHCLDPLGTLARLHARLRPTGVLFMAVPDKRFTFDGPRPVTLYAHLLEEHAAGGEGFRRAHTEEWVRVIEGRIDDVDERVDELLASDYRIHYHVWTAAEILELMVGARRDLGLSFQVEASMAHGLEFIVVLRRTA